MKRLLYFVLGALIVGSITHAAFDITDLVPGPVSVADFNSRFNTIENWADPMDVDSDSRIDVPAGIDATGTPDGTKYLRDDGVWAVPAGGSGEVNTGSNVGGGLDNFSAKIGVDLRFNSFDPSDFDLLANLISIDASVARSADNPAAGDIAGSLTAGYNLNADTVGLPELAACPGPTQIVEYGASGVPSCIATPSGGGPGTFLGLTDTPGAYTGEAGNFVQVNPGEDGLIFSPVAGGGSYTPGSATDWTETITADSGAQTAPTTVSEALDDLANWGNHEQIRYASVFAERFPATTTGGIQEAWDDCATGGGDDGCIVQLPRGDVTITTTIDFSRDSGSRYAGGLVVRGHGRALYNAGGGATISGTTLQWAGAIDGTVMRVQGKGFVFQDFEVMLDQGSDGINVAQYGISIEADNETSEPTGMITFRDVSVMGTTSGTPDATRQWAIQGVGLGADPINDQIDEISFDNLTIGRVDRCFYLNNRQALVMRFDNLGCAFDDVGIWVEAGYVGIFNSFIASNGDADSAIVTDNDDNSPTLYVDLRSNNFDLEDTMVLRDTTDGVGSKIINIINNQLALHGTVEPLIFDLDQDRTTIRIEGNSFSERGGAGAITRGFDFNPLSGNQTYVYFGHNQWSPQLTISGGVTNVAQTEVYCERPDIAPAGGSLPCEHTGINTHVISPVDTCAVRESIIASAADGDTIFFQNGTHDASCFASEPLAHTLHLTGEPGATISGSGTNILFWFTSATGTLRVEGLRFTNARMAFGSPSGTGEIGRIIFTENQFDNMESGIRMPGRLLEAFVSENSFTDLTADGVDGEGAVFLGNDNAGPLQVGRLIVTNNNFRNLQRSVGSVNEWHAILVKGSQPLVTGNIIQDFSCEGDITACEAIYAGGERDVIANNSLWNVEGKAIQLKGEDYKVVKGNLIHYDDPLPANFDVGRSIDVFTDYSLISDNIIINPPDRAITNEGTVKDTVVQGNKIYHPTGAIVLHFRDEIVVKDNSFFFPERDELDVGTNQKLIFVQGTAGEAIDGVVIDGNIAYLDGRITMTGTDDWYFVSLDAGTAQTINDIVINENKIIDTGAVVGDRFWFVEDVDSQGDGNDAANNVIESANMLGWHGGFASDVQDEHRISSGFISPTIDDRLVIDVNGNSGSILHDTLIFRSGGENYFVAPTREWPDTDGQVLTYSSAGNDWEWRIPTGSGDVVGPASSTDEAFARFDGVTGKLLQNSTATLDDNGNASFNTVSTANQNPGAANLAKTLGNNAATTAPTCANQGFGADEFNVLDIDNTGSPNFVGCEGGTQVIDFSAGGGGGSGDVVGPASATDEAIARYDGTTGKLIQNSAATINDAGDVSGNIFAAADVDGDNAYEFYENSTVPGAPATANHVFAFECGGLDGELCKKDDADTVEHVYYNSGNHPQTKEIVIEVATTDDDLRWKAPSALTLMQLDCVATGATTPSAQLMRVVECNANAATCVTTGLEVSVSALLTNVSDAAPTNDSIDDGDWWGIDTVTLTTAADFIHCTVEYLQ